jgi:hypothetical protein
MSQIAVSVIYRGWEALTRSALNGVLREALRHMALRWKRRYLPKHFTKAGAKEYGYKPRQGELNPLKKGTYSNRKLRLFSHVLPNVYTGELRRLSLYGATNITAKATSTRAWARVRLPRKANFRLHELEIVSEREKVDLETFLAEDIERLVARHGHSGSASVTIQS